MRSYIDFNDGWTFHEGFSGALTTDAASGKSVRLPHTAVELPFSYFDERDYQRQFTYQKVFAAEPGWAGREITLLFDGAMANSVVYLNGVEIASHKDGYTPFAARLTGRLKPGKNLLTVTIDGTENPEIPPFGGRIDYFFAEDFGMELWGAYLIRVSSELEDSLETNFNESLIVDIPQSLQWLAGANFLAGGVDV